VKEQLPQIRHEQLEDCINHFNTQKTAGMGNAIWKRFKDGQMLLQSAVLVLQNTMDQMQMDGVSIKIEFVLDLVKRERSGKPLLQTRTDHFADYSDGWDSTTLQYRTKLRHLAIQRYNLIRLKKGNY
jgi:hypothetical protein